MTLAYRRFFFCSVDAQAVHRHEGADRAALHPGLNVRPVAVLVEAAQVGHAGAVGQVRQITVIERRVVRQRAAAGDGGVPVLKVDVFQLEDQIGRAHV